MLLLEPLGIERQPTILPTVDPVTEPSGAHGIVVAQIFTVAAGQVDAFARAAESTFARYRSIAGVREEGVLVTLDRALQPAVDRGASALTGTGLLRGAPEWDVMDPTHRSRLRWWPM